VTTPSSPAESEQLRTERFALLHQLEDRLEMPMVVLGFAWLVLLIIEFVHGLSPLLEWLSAGIWAIFIFDFLLKFFLAPEKWAYLKHNWLMLIALLVPALRIFRVARAVSLLRAARATRSLRLVKVLTSLNRGLSALGDTMNRRGFGYVLATTVLVTFTGAAGMYAFENNPDNPRALNDYGTALWWTAMIMTTMGSAFWPESAEGRVLCLLLSVYAFTVFGYVTATLASFFVGRDNERATDGTADETTDAQLLASLRQDMAVLREELRARRGNNG
jgi:voltage-gated potassium channel